MKKEGERGISKRELMNRTGASSQTIHNWRTLYKNGGIESLLSHNKQGFKPSVFSKEEHDRLSTILHDANNELTGFVELREWVKKEFGKEVKYNTLLKYCIHNFGAKTKVARKSHVKKDDAGVADFKKTLIISAEKPLKK
ncbi:transposase [Pedobacter sp.]